MKHVCIKDITRIILHGLGNTLLNCSLADECQLFYLCFTQRHNFIEIGLSTMLAFTFFPAQFCHISLSVYIIFDRSGLETVSACSLLNTEALCGFCLNRLFDSMCMHHSN